MEQRLLGREALLAGGVAAVGAALLAWLGPPGTDLAAHVYQRALFVDHGYSLWNNFWYAGHYTFVTYSLLYYPLAAVLGIRLLAVLSIAAAALAFAALVEREWGTTPRWASRTFALCWALFVLSGAYPFALGTAFGLFAALALQSSSRRSFILLAALTLAASPLAFLLLVLLLVGVVVERRPNGRMLLAAGITVGVLGAIEVVLWKLFPSTGHYPFSFAELAADIAFCLCGIGLTWRVEQARPLRFVFPAYLVASLIAFFVPSGVGENIARLRYAAFPLAVLTLSLRSWRPRVVALAALVLAGSWNLTPLAMSFVAARSDPAASPKYWTETIRYLKQNLTPSYRVEAVDTENHWPAAYLAEAGIPLARGWYRQDDFPQNELLYDAFGARAYLKWLRGLGVRYVVLTKAKPDYSARGESRLLLSGHSGLRTVHSTATVTIYAVPSPRPLVTGPGEARVLHLGRSWINMYLDKPGRYRVAVRWSPYWHTTAGCVTSGDDGMVRVVVARSEWLHLAFNVNATRALSALSGASPTVCAPAPTGFVRLDSARHRGP
ncbi:MAG: hypothetical protein QOE36_3459 [Gaiellaceae bacterium]|nr:hypothetical protein [Gaiellaceae bacterium]